MSNHLPRAFALVLLLAAAGSAPAQTGQPDTAHAELAAQSESTSTQEARAARFQAGVERAADLLENNPRLANLTHEQRRADVEFVSGNLLFALLHEMGHAHIQEMGLPVLNREEDAADAFAILHLLHVKVSVTHHVLVAAAKGWFLAAQRDEKEGTPLPFYDEHGLDAQRAYNIICLMVGSDPGAFADLADQANMPEDRQARCAGDYSNAVWSWNQVLKPHQRAPGQTKQNITVVYGPAGDYPDVADALRALGVLEILAEHEADIFTWRRPITFEARSCGQPDLHWDLSTQRIVVCYEMATDLGRLFRDYGLTNDAFKAQVSQKKK